jgi:hypothetical protein
MRSSDDTASKSPQGKRRPWRWVLAALLVPIGVVIAWLEPDEDDLFELCSTQGMPTIYRSVEADGYFDGLAEDCWGCWNYLSNTDYRFIEFSIRDHKAWGPIREPGIYRASRISADSSQCDDELTAYYTKTQLRREEFERNNWCFQLERFDKPRARYGYYQEGLGIIVSSPITGSSISASRIYFLDHKNKDVLAQSTDFGLSKYPFFQVSSFSTRRVCNDFIGRLGKRDIDRQEVIKPRKEHRQ